MDKTHKRRGQPVERPHLELTAMVYERIFSLCARGDASTPPVIGRGTPVVVGNVIGNLRNDRTAR